MSSKKKKFSEIPDNIKARLKTDYINGLNTEGKDDIHLKSQIYLEISKKLSDIISQHRDFYNEKSELTESLLNLYLSKRIERSIFKCILEDNKNVWRCERWGI